MRILSRYMQISVNRLLYSQCKRNIFRFCVCISKTNIEIIDLITIEHTIKMNIVN